MSDQTSRNIIEELAASLEISDSAYEKAEARYNDIGNYFSSSDAKCASFSPHIYPQGSFRFGTVVRPLNGHCEYDLDLGCRLCDGVTKRSHTQRQLKTLVGLDLESYRKARQIEERLEEKNRCWRLSYKDDLRFHLDAVPSIPEEESTRSTLKLTMLNAGLHESLAQNLSQFAGAITDKRSPFYNVVSPNWKISNSEGYALWFESRMKLARELMEMRALSAKAAKVDDLPARKWKSPLQQSVQILKRHRDVMFADNIEGAPISVIITTLSAAAYQGEQDVASALQRILSDMRNHVRSSIPRVPNPVNPVEDFADKWHDSAFRHLRLEENFWLWLEQAQEDFRIVASARNVIYLEEQVKAKFATTLNADRLKEKIGLGPTNIVTRPKSHDISTVPAKPWARD
jgi:hypothetical protein